MGKLRVAVIGATGYTGEELLRILSHHPEAKVERVTSESSPGIRERYSGLTLETLDDEKVIETCDFVFSCLPHKEAMTHVPVWVRAGLKVVDLSADFRLHSAALYEQWYQKHTAPELLKETVYGLTEWHRAEIKKASLIGNPGCYPTGALLGLIPLLKKKVISPNGIIIDSKSGMSGAGRKAVEEELKESARESVSAYKVGHHRHTPEIEQELSLTAGQEVIVNFTPHLMPMHRGILSTIYVQPTKKIDTESVLKIFLETYQAEPFIKILPPGNFPRTKEVTGTNKTLIGAHVDHRLGNLVIVTAIDNLMKGASGQAVQNMNLLCGFPEETALSSL